MRWDELSFLCPHCWQRQSIAVDPDQISVFVQDCEVCCHPIEFTLEFDEDQRIVGVVAEPEQ